MTRLRLAQFVDTDAHFNLIARSGRALSAGYYTPVQSDAFTRHVFGVDTQLIEDRPTSSSRRNAEWSPAAAGANAAR